MAALAIRKGNRPVFSYPAAFHLQLLQLLLKASQDKKFLSDEAEKALAAMAKGFPSQDALALLEPFCFHSNGRVRAKATAAYELCASVMVRAVNASVIGQGVLNEAGVCYLRVHETLLVFKEYVVAVTTCML